MTYDVSPAPVSKKPERLLLTLFELVIFELTLFELTFLNWGLLMLVSGQTHHPRRGEGLDWFLSFLLVSQPTALTVSLT